MLLLYISAIKEVGVPEPVCDAQRTYYIHHAGSILFITFASLYFSYKRSASLSQFVMHRGLIISTMQAVFCSLHFASLYFSYKRSASLSQFVMHRGLIISTMQAVFCSLHLLLYISAIRGQHPWVSLWCTEDLLYPPCRQYSVHYICFSIF